MSRKKVDTTHLFSTYSYEGGILILRRHLREKGYPKI